MLEAGDIVAADGRIVESYSLQVNESSLTGESTNVEKKIWKYLKNVRWVTELIWYTPAAL